MSSRTRNYGRKRGQHDRSAAARRLVLLPVVALVLWVGCSRSTGPVKHEVRKPISPSSVDESADAFPPPVIVYKDIPEVPDEVKGPLPPIDEDSPKSR
ncbi:MAG: hypothetical protein JW888_10325 [Pirellulales bacterium]|nr:hypothetical protein [Pirellulales bacterium]